MRLLLLVGLLAGMTSCSPEVEPSRPEPDVMQSKVSALQPAADSLCLDAAELQSEPETVEDIRRRRAHWSVCIGDAGQEARYLDMLVARNDPDALHEKSERLRLSAPLESERLTQLATRHGYEPPGRERDMRELAKLD